MAYRPVVSTFVMSTSVISNSYRPSPILKHRTPRGGNYCDFCGSGSVNRLYPCTNFNWNTEPIFRKDNGYWASCVTCGEIIDSLQWPHLVSRVMAEVKRRRALQTMEEPIRREELSQLQKDLVRLYKLFAAHRGAEQALLVIERSRECGA